MGMGVCRGPGPDGYKEVGTLQRGVPLRPLLLPAAGIAADDILG